MRGPSLGCPATRRRAAWWAGWLLVLSSAAGAQTAGGVSSAGARSTAAAPVAPAGATAAPSADTGARYVESCQQAIERGVIQPGCQGPLHAGELARLKEDALRTNNPNLLTLLGDAYQNNRTGISDIGQAYRWYLLAAVRGDPRAMQRLSDLYRSGQGAPSDNVKALGYARLAERLSLPGSTEAKQASAAVASLGGRMAADERALADRFAGELEQNLRQQAATPGAQDAAAAAAPAVAAGTPITSRLPGLGAAQALPDAAAPARPAPGAIGIPGSDGAAQRPRSNP